MKNSKITRLMLGLVILFSFFIFQGSSDHHGGCYDCAESESANLRIVRSHGDLDYAVVQVSVNPGGYITTIAAGRSFLLALEPGNYTVVAKSVAYGGAGQILLTKGVNLSANETKTITIN